MTGSTDASFPTHIYSEHLRLVMDRLTAGLAATQYDCCVISAGDNPPHLFDDHGPVFQPNPHFLQLYPDQDCEHGAILIRPDRQPALFFYQPDDYWHQPPQLPDWLGDEFEVLVFNQLDKLHETLLDKVGKADQKRLAWIGKPLQSNAQFGELNPVDLLNYLHYHRAVKTPFELACMRQANQLAAAGHLAARDEFFNRGSEFSIHCEFLRASTQTEKDLPYGNIIALNEHAGVLHYQHQQRQLPQAHHSFLIDAGATCCGYAADVTRTYSFTAGDLFADLVAALDEKQQLILHKIHAGTNYVDLHEQMHQLVAQVLVEAAVVSCSPEDAFAQGITETFLPHGLGHLLGLQTHDVAGHQIDALGGQQPPPENYPALRLTRQIELDQVFTIEPGIYFIPMLLKSLKNSAAGKVVNWQLIEQLLPYGGIRIEDNVRVLTTGVENFTRDAFDQAAV